MPHQVTQFLRLMTHHRCDKEPTKSGRGLSFRVYKTSGSSSVTRSRDQAERGEVWAGSVVEDLDAQGRSRQWGSTEEAQMHSFAMHVFDEKCFMCFIFIEDNNRISHILKSPSKASAV